MKIYIQTNKATTNIFGLHTQPRKTTRYTNKLKLAWGGGKRKKSPNIFPWSINQKKLVDLDQPYLKDTRIWGNFSSNYVERNPTYI